jgi:hypothetical protein
MSDVSLRNLEMGCCVEGNDHAQKVKFARCVTFFVDTLRIQSAALVIVCCVKRSSS